MKFRTTSFVLAVCLTGLVAFPACLDIETTSRINTDGSILRTITFDDDSASIYRGTFPIPIDSSWHKAIEKVGKDHFRLTASKLFRDVDAMNEALKGEYGKTLQFQFALDRTFQWFFTTYRFSETDLKYLQYDSIPLTDYVAPSEIQSFIQHEVDKKPYATRGDSLASLSVEPRFEEWRSRNVFEAMFNAFLAGVKELNDPRLNASFVLQHKDTLYECSKESLEKSNYDTLEAIFSRVLRNPLVHKAARLRHDEFKSILSKANLDFVSGTLTSNVIMPGLITGSNAQTLEANKATWRDYRDVAKILGYTMWVESRQVNWWAVVLTGVIVVLLSIFLLLSALRRRRSI